MPNAEGRREAVVGDIKPTMMSEEESDDQNAQSLQRRRPLWRSDTLDDLINDLDARIK